MEGSFRRGPIWPVPIITPHILPFTSQRASAAKSPSNARLLKHHDPDQEKARNLQSSQPNPTSHTRRRPPDQFESRRRTLRRSRNLLICANNAKTGGARCTWWRWKDEEALLVVRLCRRGPTRWLGDGGLEALLIVGGDDFIANARCQGRSRGRRWRR